MPDSLCVKCIDVMFDHRKYILSERVWQREVDHLSNTIYTI